MRLILRFLACLTGAHKTGVMTIPETIPRLALCTLFSEIALPSDFACLFLFFVPQCFRARTLGETQGCKKLCSKDRLESD